MPTKAIRTKACLFTTERSATVKRRLWFNKGFNEVSRPIEAKFNTYMQSKYPDIYEQDVGRYYTTKLLGKVGV